LVFTDDRIACYLNIHFINLRINLAKKQNKSLADTYHIARYPTVVLFDTNGSEIDRISGFSMPKAAYLQKIKQYQRREKTFSSIRQAYQEDTTNIHLAFRLAKKYVARHQPVRAKALFNKILALDLQDTSSYQPDCLYPQAMDSARQAAHYELLKRIVPHLQIRSHQYRGYLTLINHYRQVKDIPRTLRYLEAALEQLADNEILLYYYGSYVQKNKLRSYYKPAISCMRSALKMSPQKAQNWRLLARLYYQNGQLSAAIKAMQQAVELRPESTHYQQLLKTFKAEQTS